MLNKKLFSLFIFLIIIYSIFPISFDIDESSFCRYNVEIRNKITGYRILLSWNSEFSLVRRTQGVNNKLNGSQYWKFDSGESRVASYTNGVLSGAVSDFYKNGRIYGESKYVNGKLSNIKNFYWPDGQLKAINIFDSDSLVYTKIYQRDSFKKTIDSVESYFPITKISGHNRLGDTVSISFFLSKELIMLKGKTIKIVFDLEGFDSIPKKFPYPQLSAIFRGDTLDFKYEIIKDSPFMYLYGWLEMHNDSSKIAEYEGFNYLVK